MGLLSFHAKPDFSGLLKCLNSLHIYIVFLSLINVSVCIYEDQIGKFDWRQNYVGRIKFSQFETVSTATRIIVATEENVLAALNLKTGQLVWRHVLESTSSGEIHLLYLESHQAITVTGDNPFIVRGWDSTTGVLIWEWSLTVQDDAKAEFSQWAVHNGLLYHIMPVFGLHLEITAYDLSTGQNRGATSKLPAKWVNKECILTKTHYTCVSGSDDSALLISMDIISNPVQIINQPLSKFTAPFLPKGELRPFTTSSIVPGFVIDNTKIVVIKNGDFELAGFEVGHKKASVAIADGVRDAVVLQTWVDRNDKFQLTGHSLATSKQLPGIRASDPNLDLPEPLISGTFCTISSKDSLVCRILVTGGDDSLHLLQQEGQEVWTREEALANVVAVKFIDLPVSDLEAALENEFNQKEGSIWTAFTRRIMTQMNQLNALLQSLMTRDMALQGGSQISLVRDYFNLHKVIVLVTESGKIFGMDNLSGNILWARYLPYLDTERAVIYKRRSARHPPHDAYITIVAKHLDTGKGVIISLNPISGSYIGERVLQLDYKLLQTALYPKSDDEHLRALILLDEDEIVQVFPASAARNIQNMFIFVAERSTAIVQGYSLVYDGRTLNAVKIWTVNLGGGPDLGHNIVNIVAKNPEEKVHSPGKVMGDRSVLYKYLNPNLVLFITEGPDPVHKDVVGAWCVDVVSGAIVFAQTHRRARPTEHALHSDNFLAYAYYNDKQRRTELATVELYEGNERWVSESGFSSLSSPRSPQYERQAYIFPTTLTAASVTHTQRAITDIHLLFAISSGAIVEMPWSFLEPRRSTTPTPDQKEEGLIPYAPELPIPAEFIINYNQSLHRINHIFTAPAGLESTCLVLATGLDLFYTRVAPSKTFDLLKDDFDYYLISIVLAALIVATYSTKHLASKKMLKQAWK